MNENPQSPKERAVTFVGGLRRVCEDRGKRAALRRGLSQATVVDAWPVVASLGGLIGQPGESASVDIGALFATHPKESNARNFGETCRNIALGDARDVPESFERRFRRLLACSEVSDVVAQLRSWIRLAASRGVGVNYQSLFADLSNWPWYSADIRVQWARSFWQPRNATSAGHSSSDDTTVP